MKLMAPSFWFQDSVSGIARCLTPLAWLYEKLDGLTQRATSTHPVEKPVICVGNLTLGGAGKTPVVMEVVRILKDELLISPHILTRGYKRKNHQNDQPVRVDTMHTPKDVGDEPYILSQYAPTWVSADRVASARCALSAGADVIVMDDGFQNQSLFKNMNIVVVDGHQKFGNGCVFPAGPLRTSIQSGLAKADIIVLIHGDDAFYDRLCAYQKPVVRCFFAATHPVPLGPVMAYAGIGYPLKFKHYLESMGYTVVQFVSYPDHHAYTHKDCMYLIHESQRLGVPVITTQKDAIKWILPHDSPHVINIQLSYHTTEDHSMMRDYVRRCVC